MICIVMSCPSVRGTRERSADLIEYFFLEQHWVRERLKHYFQVRSILSWENCSHWIMIKQSEIPAQMGVLIFDM